MGVEVKGPLYPFRPKNKHSSRRVYKREDDGSLLFVQDVYKSKYRMPPHWYRVEWLTDLSNAQVVAAAIEFHWRAKIFFGLPQDQTSLNLSQQIRQAALDQAWRGSKRKTDDRNFRNLERNKADIEPLLIERVLESGDSKPLFYLPLRRVEKVSHIPRIKRDLSKRIPHSDLKEIRVISPYGTIIIEGDQGESRKVTFLSRFRMPKHAIGLYLRSTGNRFNREEWKKASSKFRRPIVELDSPGEAR